MGPSEQTPIGISVDHPTDGAAVVALAGEMDVASAGVVSRRLSELVDSGADIVIDLSALEFIDSTGLGVLVRAGAHARERGRTLRLRAPGENVASALAVTGLDRVFTVE
jgi:anti-anti-sigma factor